MLGLIWIRASIQGRFAISQTWRDKAVLDSNRLLGVVHKIFEISCTETDTQGYHTTLELRWRR